MLKRFSFSLPLTCVSPLLSPKVAVKTVIRDWLLGGDRHPLDSG